MKINFKRATSTAIAPTKGRVGDVGYDLYADIDKDIKIFSHDTKKIDTGISIEIPEGYFGAVFPRSGLSMKGLTLGNCVGVIDSNYRGSIGVLIHNNSNDVQTIGAYERIAQLIIVPYACIEFNEVEELKASNRGNNGFGSSGRF